ncbi:MAG: LysM peptidoglycan-binding domain-containing protein [Anaerolineales bacterium]
MTNLPPSTSSDVINSYRKRRQRNNPNLVYILAGVFLLGGLILLIVWLSQPNQPIGRLFATETPTPTVTYTPTSTSTPTATSTLTETPTITPTPTYASPFNYTVQSGDYLALLVDKFGLGDDGIAKLISLNPYGGIDPNTQLPLGIDPTTLNIVPGMLILIPNPDYQLPTATAIPADLPRGTKVDYTVQSGDSLAAIAAKFNSTEEEIAKVNNITDPSKIFVGQALVIPVNLVTSTPTRPPTSTPVTPGPGTLLPTLTLTPINAPTATP